MADERRLIDANALLKKARRTYPPTMANPYGGDNVVSVEDIEKTPTVDAVEVVRCFACEKEGTEECPMVHKDKFFENLFAETRGTDSCSRGKRRTKYG